MTSRFRKWVLSSPPGEWAINQTRELLIGATKQGPVPQHIAFVMDGNRRYARERRLETVEGHNLGYEALAKILEVSFKSGVRVVTVYAFSIENFKRSAYEVDALMDLAKTKLTQLAQHGELLDRYGARVRVLGQRDLLKPDVIAAIERAEQLTAGNDQCILNICFPYTSREEMSTGIKKTVEEFSKPIETRSSPEKNRRSALQEERIAHMIRSQLSDHQRQQQSYNSHLSPSSSTTWLSSPEANDVDADGRLDGEVDHDMSSVSSSTTLQSSEITPTPTSTSTSLSTCPSPVSAPVSAPTLGLETESSPCRTIHNDKAAHQAHKKVPPPSARQDGIQYPNPENITSSTLNAHMYTCQDPPLDLLIRTSGVARLSDFMLWQCHQDTHVVFLDILWPEFDLWTFLPVLWEWQWRATRRKDGE